jgi:serine/threonine protein kinase
MANNPEGHLRRKRRKLWQAQDHVIDHGQHENAPEEAKQPAVSAYNFLHIVNLIVDMEIPILFPGKARPRNSYALLGCGGSFLVFKEPTTMDDVIIQPHEVWSLADDIVLKRTRSQLHNSSSTQASNDSARFASIMAELQILTNSSVREHENIIDFLGLTWDFEPNANGFESVWPVLALEAAHCTFETLLYESRDGPTASRLKYCHDIAKALSFLHDSGVAHCDIKSENVLICMSQLSGSSGMVAKLTDFGSSILDISPETHLPYGIAGTPPWNAPEWNNELAGLDILKADIYSFGMLIWRAAATCGFFEDIRSDIEQREQLIRTTNAKKISDEIVDIAIQDIRASDSVSQYPEELGKLLQHTLKRDVTSRWNMKSVEESLAEILKEFDNSDEDQESHSDTSGDASLDPELEGVGLQSGNSEMEDDGRIQAASLMPFSQDVSPQSCFLGVAAKYRIPV